MFMIDVSSKNMLVRISEHHKIHQLKNAPMNYLMEDTATFLHSVILNEKN